MICEVCKCEAQLMVLATDHCVCVSCLAVQAPELARVYQRTFGEWIHINPTCTRERVQSEIYLKSKALNVAPG